MAKFSIELVMAEDGLVDVEATSEALEEALHAQNDQTLEAREACGPAVSAVFDANKGKTMSMRSMVALALQNMNVTPEDYAAKEEAVRAYIKNDADIQVSKGKGGGVKRLSDQPSKTEGE